MLHVTNGDSVLPALRDAVDGDLLSWIDVLHDGPVPAQSDEELAETRARFVSSVGWVTYDDALRSFRERDAKLASHLDDDEIVLWFEHDLFDQLQLIQILERLERRKQCAVVSLINIDRFEGVEHFIGLGQLAAEQLVSLFPSRKPVTAAQLSLARDAWVAFTANDPTQLHDLVTARDTSSLPFLRAALVRWFEEFPSTHNGLSRTNEQILRAVADGARSRFDIFRRSQSMEEAIFMGDASVFSRIECLASEPMAAITQVDDIYSITDFGRELLAGDADWIAKRSGIDEWLGGTHLVGIDVWRSSRERKRFSRERS